MCCSFRGRRRALDVSIVIFRGRRSALDVLCCVFFVQIALAVLRQVATRCKFRGSRGILCDVLKIDGSLARNIDFEVANFQVLRKTRRKTSILKLQSVKIGGSLARNARPLASLVFPWPRRVYGGSCKTCPFVMLPPVKIGGSLVRNAVFLHPRVLSRVSRFPVASPCLWGKPQNLSFSNVSTQLVMLFCVAGVALCDIPT